MNVKPRHTASKLRTRKPEEKIRKQVIERIYHDWDAALSHSDVEGLLAMYAPDAVLESPVVPHLMSKDVGICTGHRELRPFFEVLRQRKPPVRRHYRAGYFTDGKKVIWEYPRDTPQGDQMDFVEVMEINEDGLIQHHRVYWGWYGVRVLQRNQYRKEEQGEKKSKAQKRVAESKR